MALGFRLLEGADGRKVVAEFLGLPALSEPNSIGDGEVAVRTPCPLLQAWLRLAPLL
jgi:hypothetical protein